MYSKACVCDPKCSSEKKCIFEVQDEKIGLDEKIEIIDHFVQQLYNSGYCTTQMRDIVESSLKGIERKEKRRKENENRYRSGSDTLFERERKKLLESTNWYREKLGESETTDVEKLKSTEGSWKRYRRKYVNKKKTDKNVNTKDVDGKEKIISVLFAPHTEKSSLAKRWRNKLEQFERLGTVTLKVV